MPFRVTVPLVAKFTSFIIVPPAFRLILPAAAVSASDVRFTAPLKLVPPD